MENGDTGTAALENGCIGELMHVCSNGLLGDAAVHRFDSEKSDAPYDIQPVRKGTLQKHFAVLQAFSGFFYFFGTFCFFIGTAVAQYDLRTVGKGGSNLGTSKDVKAAAW
ncbi:MAG: hypothetical protein K0Q48_767 [Bacillota bacterium]|jgi:hypothetical protein|nr:hypothetical protein [Bacillota bacterium]